MVADGLGNVVFFSNGYEGRDGLVLTSGGLTAYYSGSLAMIYFFSSSESSSSESKSPFFFTYYSLSFVSSSFTYCLDGKVLI
jgi:hypothetical protein